jgi:UDP-GlcNAc:undecaprenyl-phosphate GlcNAc-1-phosphate transferase
LTAVVALAVGFLTARLAWLLLRPAFRSTVFLRQNHRGRPVPTGVGVVLALVVLLVEGGRALATAAGVGEQAPPEPARLAAVIAAAGFGLLGLLDDLAASPDDARGFRGHLAALARAELTTGGVKLLGGGAVALIAVATARPDSGTGVRLLADALLVALAANLANLFDRAPGRTIKVGAAAFVALVALTAPVGVPVSVALVVGGALGLLLDDLHEHLMLGDAGANVLGAALGLGVVLAGSPTARAVTLAFLAVLNLVGEWVSFSRVIDAVPPLRAADRAGRRSR